MKRRRYIALVLALVLFALSLSVIVPVSKKFLDHAFKPGLIEAVASSQTPVAFQGLIFQEKALATPDILPVYGSSEFSAESEFHPSKVFDGKPDGFVPFLIGRGGSQSLVHVLSLAAQGEGLRGKKIALILSPQWFMPEGITAQYLDQNFSPLQAYQILYHSNLSDQLKKEISQRLLQFPQVLKKYPVLEQNLRLYDNKSFSTPRKRIIQWAGQAEYWGLEVQDFYRTATFIPLVHQDVIARNAVTTFSQTPDWKKLKEDAQKQGEEATGNNRFGILNAYYSKYIEPKLAESANSFSGAKFYPSPEYRDLELLMRVLKEEGAQAMFVIVPVNGFWYDYTGFPTTERAAYYKRVRAMISQNGFQVADFSQHEYDRYFLQDTMHLGWKGWVYVDEALDQFYHQKP